MSERLPSIIESIIALGLNWHHLNRKLGYEPTVQELAERLSVSVNKLKKINKIGSGLFGMNLQDVDRYGSVLALAANYSNVAARDDIEQSLYLVLASLTPREERVLRMRFGIGMNTDHTLEEVGQQISVTRERIRQIEANALRKLKHPSRSRKMRSFLDV
jgi:RNA polymerase primary sigma factor